MYTNKNAFYSLFPYFERKLKKSQCVNVILFLFVLKTSWDLDKRLLDLLEQQKGFFTPFSDIVRASRSVKKVWRPAGEDIGSLQSLPVWETGLWVWFFSCDGQLGKRRPSFLHVSLFLYDLLCIHTCTYLCTYFHLIRVCRLCIVFVF